MADLAAAAGLTPEEAKEARRRAGRELNSLEWAILGVQWSEHCAYKHSKELLRSLPKEGASVMAGPGASAGVLDLGDGWACAAKIESHNHPSAVEPLQGAATGLGGIMRDVLAMGARPAAFLDSLRFGPLDDPRSAFLARGVVAGVGHYGNCVGVPTVGGDVYYHPSYQRNPLVNAMCVGFLRHEEMRSAAAAGEGNVFLLLGAATGREGIGGAAFASVELQADASQDRPRVQVGDPFFGKLLIEATLEILRDLKVVAIQDLGSGGLAGASIEMCHQGGVGAEIELAQVPLRAQDLVPPEILLSESQERMLLCLRPEDVAPAQAVARRYGIEAAAIGRITAKPAMRFLFHGQCLSELDTAIYAEAPLRHLPEGMPVGHRALLTYDAPAARQDLLSLLGLPDLSDRSPIYSTYDQDVGLRTVVRPGLDAAVLRAALGAPGVAVTTDQNPRLCALSPELGAEHAVAEAARNVMARGAAPIGLTNCLNLPSPEHPEGAAALRAVVAGIGHAARELGVPVTGGNVSLYNEAEGVAIVPTPVIGMIGLLPDPEHAIGVGPAVPGLEVLLLGDFAPHLGGSVFAELKSLGQSEPAQPDYEGLRRMRAVLENDAAREAIALLHDVADGGLMTALAEIALYTGLGLDLALGQADALTLFGEASAQFVALSGDPGALMAAAERAGVNCRTLGRTTAGGLRIQSDLGVWEYGQEELQRAWRREA